MKLVFWKYILLNEFFLFQGGVGSAGRQDLMAGGGAASYGAGAYGAANAANSAAAAQYWNYQQQYYQQYYNQNPQLQQQWQR